MTSMTFGELANIMKQKTEIQESSKWCKFYYQHVGMLVMRFPGRIYVHNVSDLPHCGSAQ